MGTNVQYGCGLSCPDRWINFDVSPTLRLQRLPLIGGLFRRRPPVFPGKVHYGDILKGLPIADGSADLVYASHVLEHLSYSDFWLALRNTYRMLRPGGLFRLIVPDLEIRAVRYLEMLKRGEADANSWFIRVSSIGAETRPRRPLAFLRLMFGSSHHLWMWDEASMTMALRKTGFVDIRRCQLNDSTNAAFRQVEDAGRFRDPTYGLLECAMEARKPLD